MNFMKQNKKSYYLTINKQNNDGNKKKLTINEQPLSLIRNYDPINNINNINNGFSQRKRVSLQYIYMSLFIFKLYNLNLFLSIPRL